MSKRWPYVVAGLLVLALAAPFMLNLAGDAQVHLAIAENFAEGRPFQYNPNGETVVASTSPFWTMLLALYFTVAGDATPLLLSLTNLAIWLAAAYLLYRAARDLWQFRGVALWAVVLLWLLHTTIVANALGGLENVLSALQLLLLYMLLAARRPLTPGRSALFGLVLGWAILTRPDGGLFALVLLTLALPVLRAAAGRTWPALLGRLAIIVVVALAVLAPWYWYQAGQTGQLVTDSSLARLYNGRMGSLEIMPGLLYLHPKALVSLATAFAPLAAGYLLEAGALVVALSRASGRRMDWYREQFPQAAAVSLIAAGVTFFTFVVGAEAFGRYFLPLFPFLFLTGVAGWQRIYGWAMQRAGQRAAAALVALVVLFMATTSLLDTYRRLLPGRYAVTNALDVIYGPANLRYYAVNLPDLLAAPGMRAAATDEFLNDLSASSPASMAVTEVQLRYFLDERVDVLSLDGRTSAGILDYVDPNSGVPDFARYFRDIRPDYVHAKQWCEVGGWLANVLPSAIDDNLVCVWEKAAAEMAIGERFDWQGQTVTLVAPEILRIDWSAGGQ